VRRRDFIALIGGAAAATWPLAARAQTLRRIFRIGTASPNPRAFIGWVAFDQRMRELGYVEGQNLVFEFIDNGDQLDRMGEAIEELVRRKVDVIVDSSGTEQSLKVALAATSTLPIVTIAIQYDPVALGHVSSLARQAMSPASTFVDRNWLKSRWSFLLRPVPGGHDWACSGT